MGGGQVEEFWGGQGPPRSSSGSAIELSQYPYNSHQFPYNFYPSPLGTTKFLTKFGKFKGNNILIQIQGIKGCPNLGKFLR